MSDNLLIVLGWLFGFVMIRDYDRMARQIAPYIRRVKPYDPEPTIR